MRASFNTAQSAMTMPDHVSLHVAMVPHASAYTNKAPAIEVSVPDHVHYRTISVALYLVAAVIEASSLEEPWCVDVEERSDGTGRVVLLLGTESQGEAAKALSLLRTVAERMRSAHL